MQYKMPSINNFSNMYRLKTVPYEKTLSYAIKPKIHGTNGSILITGDKFECRSKNRILTPMDDHMDFTKSMMAIEDQWTEYHENYWNGQDIVVYGEWAGPGVQKTDAVSMIEHKIFFVFAVYAIDEGVFTTDLNVYDHIESPMVYEITPIRTKTLNFNTFQPVQDFVDMVNKEVEAFEKCDHFIKAEFNIEGCGEGIVGCPVWSPTMTHFEEFTFKAKTEAHRVKKTKAPASSLETLPQEALEFAETYVTEARMRQAISELGINVPTMQNTSDIIVWMNTDIIKESLDDVQEMGIEYGKMQKYVNTKIVNMWKAFANGDLK